MGIFETKNIEEKMYEIVFPIVEAKITKCVTRLLKRGPINYNNIYSISFIKPSDLKHYLFKVTPDTKRRYVYEKDRIEIFNSVLSKILYHNKYKLKPVCKYGYNNLLCFDFIRTGVYDYTAVIGLFFKFRK
jgi:hypothetical protein